MSEPLKIEVVTHCYRYATLLRHQLSSLVLGPPQPGVQVTATVFHTPEDEETTRAVAWFAQQSVAGVRWNRQPLPRAELCRRSIGRNRAALATQADWVWFCDADYWFSTECWEAFTRLGRTDAQLIYPREVNGHCSHDLGDACIQRARETEGLVSVSISEFEPERMNRAIGGIQIVSGDYCREHGYLKNSRRAQQPREVCEVDPEIRASSEVMRLWWFRLGVTPQTRPNEMKAKRKRHDAQFKARVALEALKGVKTVQQIAKEFDVHPVQVSDWKKKLSTQAGSVFETGRQQEQEDFSAERTDLHSKIGELTVKLDFVVKKSKQLGVWSGLPDSSNLNTRS